MSPEQAEGTSIDARSDIFSMGVILYQWLTGELPFQGHTAASTLSSVIKDTAPSLTAVKPELPRDLGRIVRRCLHKDVTRRFQTALDLRNELAELLEALRTEETIAVPTSSQSSHWLGYLAAGLVGASLVAIPGYFIRSRDRADMPRLVNPVQVTSALGVEDFPSWSPDGQTLAYGVNPEANLGGGRGAYWDIWITQIGSDHGLNRTSDFRDEFRYPVWSPDGRQLAAWSGREGGGYFVMPALAGPVRKIASFDPLDPHRPVPPQWSPDGFKLVGMVGQYGVATVLSLDTGDTQRIELPGENASRFDLSWSPDGRFLAYVDAAVHTAQGPTTIWVWRWEDEQAWPITSGPGNNWSPTWFPDSRSLFYVSNRGGSRDLWEQRLDKNGNVAGEPMAVTTGLGVLHASFSRDGSKLAYARGRRISNVWRVPISTDRPATWADAEQLTFDQAFVETLDVSKDGRLVLSTDRSGNPDLWIRDGESGEMQQLTTDSTPDWAPKWSPDGEEVAFYAFRGGQRELWTVPAGGGKARKVTKGLFPDWSPDGQSIAFWDGNDVWIVPAEGGEARRVTTDPAVDSSPIWSPDGRSLAFVSRRAKEPRLWQLELETGQLDQLSEGPASLARWSRDGTRVYFLGAEERRSNIWAVSVEDGTERPVTSFEGRHGSLANALAADGTYLYFAWEESVSDIWVMDVVTDESE